jgi:hypothetical protein
MLHLCWSEFMLLVHADIILPLFRIHRSLSLEMSSSPEWAAHITFSILKLLGGGGGLHHRSNNLLVFYGGGSVAWWCLHLTFKNSVSCVLVILNFSHSSLILLFKIVWLREIFRNPVCCSLSYNLMQGMVVVFDHLTDQLNEVQVLWNVFRLCKPVFRLCEPCCL